MTTDWRKYPFRLVSGDSALDFPAAEGLHADQESDTWFIAGELTATTGRKFAYLTIFNKNRPGGTVVADFYTMALFDCDTGEYGTYTDYDMPPKNMQPGAQPKMTMATGYLDIRYESSAGPVAWTSCRDDDGALRPYTYRVSLRGVDQAGQSMELDLDVTPTRAPVPVGANTYGGKIICFGQPDTYSYFQTGMVMNGTLRWGEQHEVVSGSAGHVDRQWFPKYAGGGGTGGDPRSRSHEWRTINLDNGVDMSIWHQFDRLDGNALQPFSGATVSYPDPSKAPECAEDVEVTVSTYVRWPKSIRPLVRAAGSGPVHARPASAAQRRTGIGPHRRTAGPGAGPRAADRIHGRAVSLSRNNARGTGERLRFLRTLAGDVPGLGADRRAGVRSRQPERCARSTSFARRGWKSVRGPKAAAGQSLDRLPRTARMSPRR